jgi:hypothetical protein
MRLAILLLIYIVGLGFLISQPAQMTVAQNDIPLESVGNESNNQTATNTTATNSGTEQFTLKAEMKPHSNQFMPEGYFEIKNFGFVPTDGSEICPQNNCKYTVENGQFSPNTFSGGYTFEGRLKVTTQEGDVKKSKFYDFNVALDKTSEEERNGETLQFLEGTFGLGKDTYNPDISYDITNATLKVDEKNPVLTIQGERSPF